VTFLKFHVEYPQILGTDIENLFIWVTWCLGFVHPIPLYCAKMMLRIGVLMELHVIIIAIPTVMFHCTQFKAFIAKSFQHLIKPQRQSTPHQTTQKYSLVPRNPTIVMRNFEFSVYLAALH
jgi:hypothetical protein